MAINIDQINSVSRDLYLPVVTDQIYEGHPLLKLMKEKKQKSSGTSIIVPVKYDNLNTGGFGAGTIFNIDKKDFIQSAQLPVRGAYANVTYDKFEDGLNGGETRVVSIVEERMKALEESMRLKMVEMLFGDNSGIGATEFIGLAAVLRDDNTYGQISRTATVAVDGYDGSFWRAKVFQNPAAPGTARALTLQILQDAFMQITRGGLEAKDTVIVVNYAVYNKIWDLLMDKFRIVGKDEKLANLGFTNFTFNGVPVLAEPAIQDNHVRFVNHNHFQLRTHSDNDFRLTDVKAKSDSELYTQQLLVQGNFICAKPSALGIIKDIDPAL